MKSELETIKTAHIINQGFAWSYDIKQNPDCPDVSIIIRHNEEGKTIGEISIPRCAISHVVESLNYFI